MPAIIEPQGPGENGAPLWRKLLWFAGIAVGSSLGTVIVAYAMRALLFLK